MKNFEIGDKVEYFNEGGRRDDPANGSVGVVEAKEGRSILVSFEGFDGHSGMGVLGKRNGWWADIDMLELVEEDTFIAKLSKDYLALIAQIMHDGSAKPEERIKLIQEEIDAYNIEVEEYKTERPFKVGDILIGTDDARYSVTNNKSIVKVVDVLPKKYDEGFMIVVELIGRNPIYKWVDIGERFTVFEKYFERVI